MTARESIAAIEAMKQPRKPPEWRYSRGGRGEVLVDQNGKILGEIGANTFSTGYFTRVNGANFGDYFDIESARRAVERAALRGEA